MSGRRGGQRRSFASPGVIRFIAGTAMSIGVLTGIAGVAYDINGATQAAAYVHVTVYARPQAVLEAHGTTPAGALGTVLARYGQPENAGPFTIRLPDVPGFSDVGPASSTVQAPIGPLTLRAWDSTTAEQMLNRGGFAVLGLCMALGAVWLRRLLLAIADGQPFQSGNSARIAGIAALVTIGSLANGILPAIASGLVLTRAGLGAASSPVFAEVHLSLGMLVAVPFLLVLAQAFRRGAELAQDVDGLV